jgi:hypothetical protein
MGCLPRNRTSNPRIRSNMDPNANSPPPGIGTFPLMIHRDSARARFPADRLAEFAFTLTVLTAGQCCGFEHWRAVRATP